jgi:UDP-N-acetylglucosamine 4,6-dehydratase
MIQEKTLARKNVLITGGTGTLGRALVKAISSFEWGCPSSLTIFSRGEDEQKEMAEEWDSAKVLRFIPGDICDFAKRCEKAWRGAQIIIHCAAMKAVDQCEDIPWLAVRTNVKGTFSLAVAARQHPITAEKVVLISSDKAITPVGVYGATKLLAERIIVGFGCDYQHPVFSVVRLVNLWGSTGSVVPLFRRQIAEGGPITITDNRMMRWFIWPSDAATFILNTLKDARSGEIAIPPGYAMRIMDVATALMIEADTQVDIKTIGKRPGEKLQEAKVADYELSRYVLRNYPLILPEFNAKPWGKDQPLKDAGPQGYKLTPSAIARMIKEKGG